MADRLLDKTAIITGAAGGIGRRIAHRFAEQGARLLLTDTSDESLATLQHELPGEAVAVAVDLTRDDAGTILANVALEQLGRIDIVVNNAALNLADDVLVVDADVDDWKKVMEVNLYAPLRISQAVIPHMVEIGRGAFVNVTSGAGLFGDLSRPAYGASKAALANLTQYIATQYGKSGVRANAVSPGLVLHDALRAAMPQAYIDAIQESVLAPRPGEADDIAQTVLFLASDESEFINGQVWRVDAGMGAHGPHMASVARLSQ